MRDGIVLATAAFTTAALFREYKSLGGVWYVAVVLAPELAFVWLVAALLMLV